jgi:hypothetical protein
LPGDSLPARGFPLYDGGVLREVNVLELFLGLLLVAIGIGAVASALPITHRLVRLMPQWTFTRGDVDRLGSTTFLTASIGLLAVMSGIALVLLATLPD